MESKQYFILKNKEKQGPFALEELENLVSHDTKVWHSGMDKWEKASALPELQDHFLSQPPEVNNNKMFILGGIGLLILLIVAVFAIKPKLLGFGNQISNSHDSAYNNQQLYTMYGPGIVLIQHKYMYEITVGNKKYYFNDFSYYDTTCYLTGLTENRATAVNNAQPIQGTGFFISNNGKILTNRHVALADPNLVDQEYIQKALLNELTYAADDENQFKTIKATIAQYDSTLILLLQDSVTNATKIAEIKGKLIDSQNILDERDGEDGEDGVEKLVADPTVIDYLRNYTVSVRKITLDLRIFTSGTRNTDYDGAKCNIISTSQDQDVDLAIIQTYNQQLPEPSIKMPKLSRIRNISNDSLMPQMSERLVMIGYNQGTVLSNTNDGIKSQLTEGKISQNTDEFKLMYTIPSLAGSSGSPVLDEKGRLVSVNFAGVSQTQSFNYGIQPRKIREFLKKNNIVM